MSDPRFQPGRDGTIISFCPDTEPFKTVASTQLVVSIAKLALGLDNRVQFSTKEIVPEAFWKEISQAQRYFGQVVMFVSITTFSKSSRIEPNAAPPSNRLLNFSAGASNNVATCLFIKPFTKLSSADLSMFIAAIKNNKPDSICVGVLYQSSLAKERTAGKHPAHNELRTKGITAEMMKFAEAIEANSTAPLLFSSVCASGLLSDTRPRPDIRRVLPHLCRDCSNKKCSA